MLSSLNSSQTLLEEVKNQKILYALKGEIREDKPHKRFHDYISEPYNEKKNIISFIEKDRGELVRLNINQILLSATLYQEIG